MSKIIIGIHGLGNKPPKEILESWWNQSLREGFRRINNPRVFLNFELVYWADLVHPKPLDINITDEEDPHYLEEYYMPARKIKHTQPSSLRKKLMGYLEKQMDKLFLNDDMTLNFSSISDKFINRYFKDLETYYMDSKNNGDADKVSIRDQIRERLADVLKKHKTKEILLLSHSMGSIVAYDVLTQSVPDVEIDTLITAGSPLGLPIIVGRIFAEQHRTFETVDKVRTPDNVNRSWFNFSDLEDRIAIDPTLHDDFAENKRNIRAVDITVNNDYENRGVRNAHKTYGYLRTPELVQVINDFIDRDKPRFILKFERWLNGWLSNFIETHK